MPKESSERTLAWPIKVVAFLSPHLGVVLALFLSGRAAKRQALECWEWTGYGLLALAMIVVLYMQVFSHIGIFLLYVSICLAGGLVALQKKITL